jgi:hypothetical protein
MTTANYRTAALKEAPLDPRSLVGSYFLTDPARGWQGIVVAEPSPGVYLCELFEWMVGSPTHQQLIPLDDMFGWRFFDNSEWLDNDYRDRTAARWEHERKQAGE